MRSVTSVCLSVFPVGVQTFESLDPRVETSFLVCMCAFRISRSGSYINVIGSRSSSQEQKVVQPRLKKHIFAGSPSSNKLINFYRASYASAILAVIVCLSVCPSVLPSVRLSVTSRSCTKTAKLRITLRTAYDSPETLVFRCQKSRRNSNDITPNGGAKWRWGRFESGDLYHRTTLPLGRSTAATLCSSAMIDANDAFTVAERYRRTAINNVRSKSIIGVYIK